MIEGMGGRLQEASVKISRKLGILRSRCYKRVFQDETGQQPSDDGKAILADLRTFANIGRSAFPIAVDHQFRMDPVKLARIEGRREVVWRILDHLNLDEDAIQAFVEVQNDA